MNILTMSMEFERLPTESILFESEELNQAVELSSQIPDNSRQWQTYINALGLFTFAKWLEERDENLTVSWEESTIANRALANVISSVANLQVGKFNLCLITVGSLFEEQVSLPRLVVELPEYVPHFYVLVEVLEEQECGMVRGFINYQQLWENLENVQRNTQLDWTYKIPLTWFEKDCERLLLYLRVLESEALPLPTVPSDRKQQLAASERELVRLLPQLQAPEKELWEILTWEQGRAVLTSPELLEWVYKLQNNNLELENIETQTSASLQTYLSDFIKLITQPAINLGRWLWDELDEIGESLSWILLPRLTPVREFRSPVEEFEAIKSQLEAQGLEIPTGARCGYHNFLLAGIPLRIYAVAWNLSTNNNPNSWSLLLVLGVPSPNTLPHNLKFRVSDQTCILTEKGVNPEQVESYLYTCVVGDWNEKFIVSVSIADGVEVTLPPFVFDITQPG
ncbi:hypothetical protein WA1_06405 [Scytonema hofmannii PCC 7110]|uniref:DUF1822 family protein n=1 Tax=Scytonema hofmannii PCC 7110 TaxID=128403 RepID=A0A139WSR1_9CYAN|nr:DUF1822 family protein [Scytonema hofmannii]KYC35453.1 hypothetical protein WA1_06405 [Scytonema hofmannii PCC 7110]